MRNHCTYEWQSLRGEIVEVRRGFILYRCGVVDDVMPDASGVWLASDGIHSREFIDKASGFSIWSAYPHRERKASASLSVDAGAVVPAPKS
jgi:hypothetical protein